MLRKPGGQKKIFLLILAIFLIVLLMSPRLQRTLLHPVERSVIDVGSIVGGAATFLVNGVRNVWTGYIDLISVRDENQTLRERLARLEGEVTVLREEEQEAKRLHKLLEFKAKIPYRMAAARVIGRNPTSADRTLLIDKGSSEGIDVDMGVVAPDGIVGRVIRVFPSYSQVLLITDRNSAIAAELENTRDQGIVEGAEGGLSRIRYLPLSSDIRLGEGVITSGLIGIHPKGLLIGRVGRVERRETELFQVVDIVPQVDFSRLEEVLVILNLPQIPLSPPVEGGSR